MNTAVSALVYKLLLSRGNKTTALSFRPKSLESGEGMCQTKAIVTHLVSPRTPHKAARPGGAAPALAWEGQRGWACGISCPLGAVGLAGC